ncbi:MAG: nitrate reductase molybdenum cofactor assembly chaperone [Ectothiorhodospiraceae bacterium]|nr:nitrate reductase molybdenum cofactor assembly chaperone [Ectothiorhodospiraceae bacterium]
MRILKAIAVLLHYPDEVLQRHGGELAELIAAEQGLSGDTRQALQAFIREVQQAELMDLQAGYVGLFDRSRTLSLHLFEHVHGESRDRGQAMVELQDIYREAGFVIAANELPDYLPLFLEFCSQLPADEARDWLQRSSHLLQELEARLAQRNSGYAVLFRALLELGGIPAADQQLRGQIAREAPDDTPEALDRVWEEEQVTFGPVAGCGGAKTHTGQAVPVDVSRLRRSQG